MSTTRSLLMCKKHLETAISKFGGKKEEIGKRKRIRGHSF